MTQPITGEFEQNPLFERNFVNGEWQFSRYGYDLDINSPSTMEDLATICLSSSIDVDLAMDSARGELARWSQRTWRDRLACLRRFYGSLVLSQARVAAIESFDTGVPYDFAFEMIQHALEHIRSSMDELDQLSEKALEGYLSHSVPGVVAVIGAASSPIYFYAKSVLRQLVQGNTVILKPSSSSPFSGTVFVELLLQAGFPKHSINLLQGMGKDVGAALAAHPGIDSVVFYGRRSTAQAVLRATGNNFAATELHASPINPHIVRSTQHLDTLVGQIGRYIMTNAGQYGEFGRVLFVEKSLLGEVSAGLRAMFDALHYGSIRSQKTDVAPITTELRLRRLERFLEKIKSTDAELICGGERVESKSCKFGFYIRPMLVRVENIELVKTQSEICGPMVFMLAWETDEQLSYLLEQIPRRERITVWGDEPQTVSRIPALAMRNIRFNNGCEFQNEKLLR